jgi:hypothetical protein
VFPVLSKNDLPCTPPYRDLQAIFAAHYWNHCLRTVLQQKHHPERDLQAIFATAFRNTLQSEWLPQPSPNRETRNPSFGRYPSDLGVAACGEKECTDDTTRQNGSSCRARAAVVASEGLADDLRSRVDSGPKFLADNAWYGVIFVHQ